MSELIDVTGQKFNRLTAVSWYIGNDRQAIWRCICDCGNRVNVASYTLRKGKQKSCGCLRRDIGFTKTKTHGLKHSSTYNSWAGMKQRCTNPKSPTYHYYGGRGITLCDRWKSFDAFLADMGEAPANHSIERLDNNGGYAPSNCVWADRRTQSNNKRNNFFIEADGSRMTIAQWSRAMGVPQPLILDRINRGWDSHDAVKTPPRPIKMTRVYISKRSVEILGQPK